MLAYGNGLAGYCDVREFAKIAEVSVPEDTSAANGYDGDTMPCIKVALSFSKWLDDVHIPEVLSTPKEHHGILNPSKPTFPYGEYSFHTGKGTRYSKCPFIQVRK